MVGNGWRENGHMGTVVNYQLQVVITMVTANTVLALH